MGLVDPRAVIRRREQDLRVPTADVRSVAPSTRAFGQAIDRQRAQVERLPLLHCARPDLLEVAQALDAAEVAALAVSVDDPSAELQALRALCEASAVPVLRCDLLLGEPQLYQSRAAGCDAVLLHAALLGPRLASMVSAARGTHMAACVACETAAEVAQAQAARADVFAFPSGGAGIDPALLAALPRRALVLALPVDGAAPAAAPLLGRADAALDVPLARAPDPAAAFRAALEADGS